jgi:hypothetical protein
MNNSNIKLLSHYYMRLNSEPLNERQKYNIFEWLEPVTASWSVTRKLITLTNPREYIA